MSRRGVRSWGGLSLADLQQRWGREAVIAYGKIDSTNAAAKDLAEAGAEAGTIVVCREQTAGRGRQDRPWHSPPDTGLYMSMIFRPSASVLQPLASVLAGLGVVAALDRRLPGLDPGLKWPNDLMAGDRKMGGLLAEASWSASGPRFLVVGVGVNVKPMSGTMSPRLRKEATWIEERRPDTDLPEVADAVIEGLERWLYDPPATLDSGALDLLDEYDWLKNRRVRARLSDQEALGGVAAGVAPDGALLFRPDGGALRRITTASIEIETRGRSWR
jgi:BirA family biotin operon repressor/biotin-[acetyl-CoA-carboxylase] ligase